MEINFRKLKAEEIEVRVGQINKGGIALLLYKDARVDQKILDETVGCLNWQKHYLRDNANCVVSIWDPDKGEWVEKEDVGTDSNTEAEKGRASDSFKRACVAWGIGRELYTAPKIFIPKANLPHFSDEGGKYRCNDSFDVLDVQYVGDWIDSVTIQIHYYGKESSRMTFRNTWVVGEPAKVTTTPAKNAETKKSEKTTPAEKPEEKAEQPCIISLEEMYAKAPKAGTSEEGINEWISNKYGCEPTALTPEQIEHVCRALDKQIAKLGA